MTGRSKISIVFYLICSIGLCLNGQLVFAQDTIRYTAGPAAQFAMQPGFSTSIDLDRDGAAEISFSGGGFLCTMDIPTSYCSITYTGIPMATNSLLCKGSDFVVLPLGATIGEVPENGTAWRQYASATVAIFATSPKYETNGWLGPLSVTTEGYLGVRFNTSAGQHYGWVRVRMPKQDGTTMEFSPVIQDWAYETRPDTPIKAGAMPVAAIASPQMVRPQMLRLNWLTEVGLAYQVQFKDTLSAPGWSNLDITVIATSTNAIVDVPMQGNVGFFQAVRTE